MICASVFAGLAIAPGQTPIALKHEFKLLGVASSAAHGGGTKLRLKWADPRGEFSTQIAPDQSLVVFEPGPKNGSWPVIRVKSWWKDEPEIAVLQIPTWNDADNNQMIGVSARLQISSDGRYAAAFAGAQWLGPGEGSQLPTGYTPRASDTIVCVIDLQDWRVKGCVHMAAIHVGGFGAGQILNGQWILWQGPVEPQKAASVSCCFNNPIFTYNVQLLSFPELRAGPKCEWRATSDMNARTRESYESEIHVLDTLDRENDASCQDVLKVSGFSSIRALRSFVSSGPDPQPRALKLLEYAASPTWGSQSEEQRLESIDLCERNPSWMPRYTGSAIPLESTSHLWYGFFAPKEAGFYGLDRFDADGKLQKAEPLKVSAHYCGVQDVREDLHAVMGDCHYQPDPDYATFRDRHFVAIYRTDDLSPVGVIYLDKQRVTSEAFAAAEGQAYVLTVELGEVLRVYQLPIGP